MIFVVFLGLGNACAIMIGNKIGAGEEDTATDYGKKFVILGLFGAALFGLIMIVLANPLLTLYKVSATTINLTFRILIIMAASLPIRSLNLIARFNS